MIILEESKIVNEELVMFLEDSLNTYKKDKKANKKKPSNKKTYKL